jgi:hypothetical protein
MKQHFLIWGVGGVAFAVTLAISSWHDGLWESGETVASSARTAIPVTASSSVTAATPVPARPFGPVSTNTEVTTPTVTAVTPQSPAPQQQETPAPTESPPPDTHDAVPDSAPSADEAEFRARSDRAAEHSARAH